MSLRKQLSFVIFILLICAFSLYAQQPSRFSDDEVKKMVEQAKESAEKYKSSLKKVVGFTNREGVKVDVQQYMKDYENTFNRFKEAFDSRRTPSSDLVSLQRMTNEIDGVMTRNSDLAGSGSEWQAHRTNMEHLLQAFQTTLDEGAPPPKRLSDEQVKNLMEELKQSSKSLGKSIKDAMKKDKSIDKNTQKATDQTLKALEKQADELKNLFNSKKPLSVELNGFLKQLKVVEGFLSEHPLGTVQAPMDRMKQKVGLLSGEYGIPSAD